MYSDSTFTLSTIKKGTVIAYPNGTKHYRVVSFDKNSYGAITAVYIRLIDQQTGNLLQWYKVNPDAQCVIIQLP